MGSAMAVVVAVMMIVIGADAAYVMMMAGLDGPLVVLVTDHLFTVFAQQTVH